MSWTRTVVSTTIRVPVGRRALHATTPTPVTNIASVESMNGAPRIAPTPTSSVASPPPPNVIAMIGIMVSGRAVPTAASTEPTAPSASSSLRPNHSMPFVNSSAPARITKKAPTRSTRSAGFMSPSRGLNAAAGHDRDPDADRDHGQDRERDGGHQSLAAREIAHERRQDAGARRADRDDEREPEERFGPQR